MKKNIIRMAAVLTMAMAMSAFTVASSDKEATPERQQLASTMTMQGMHCNGTVGCDCSGFSAKTDGKEWEKGYCKKCGHKKSCHK